MRYHEILLEDYKTSAKKYKEKNDLENLSFEPEN